jgi:hypothetical protein
VLDAWDAKLNPMVTCLTHDPEREALAAALGAAAMQTLLTSYGRKGSTPNDYELGWNAAVAHLQSIATELENHQ